jgi:hypothetical protein
LHACVSALCGHATPPLLGWTKVRARDWKPVEQEVEQVDQAVQDLTMHGLGHAWLLHERASRSCGQALPPNLGATSVRERFCIPPLHELVQVVHAANVRPLQSTAQA